MYYPSHQFFLASNSVFLLVFNLAENDISRVDYWMNQIQVMNNSPLSPILIVGTHLDDKKCTPEYVEERLKFIQNKYKKHRFVGFVGTFPVSCKSGTGIKAVIDAIASTLQDEPLPVLPESWVHFYEFLKSYKQKLDYVQWSFFAGLARRCGILQHNELMKCTEFLSDVGSLIYFNDHEGNLNDIVILNPQFLADLMSTLITFKHSWVKKGKLAVEDLPQVLVRFDATLADSLLALLVRFRIIHKIKNSSDYIVPSLLPEDLPKNQIQRIWPTDTPPGYHEFNRKYKFSFLPIGFFARLIVRILHLPMINGLLFWRDGLIIELINYDQYAYLLYSTKDYTLSITVRINQGNSNKQSSALLLRNIIEVIESLLTGYYPRLKEKTAILLSCSHCMLNNKSNIDPYTFTIAECIQAVCAAKKFVFCHNIPSPSRCVYLENIAPDLCFSDVTRIDNSLITIDKQLGAGGFGVVYKGTYDNIPVAIKELKFLIGDNDERVSKFREFQQEAWIMRFLFLPLLSSFLLSFVSTPLLSLSYLSPPCVCKSPFLYSFFSLYSLYLCPLCFFPFLARFFPSRFFK